MGSTMNVLRNLQEIKQIMESWESGADYLDYETLVLERIPNCDLSEFIQTEVTNWVSITQAEILRIFAKAGHQEILPFLERFISNLDSSEKSFSAVDNLERMSSAAALAHLGDIRGLKILGELATDSDVPGQNVNYILLDFVLEHLRDIKDDRAIELEQKLRKL
jgi:hypothetical protein